jgi:hypothetical protein
MENTIFQEEVNIANKIKDKYECDIIINNEPPYTLYCVSDIGKILNMSNIRGVIRNLEKNYINKPTNGGNQKVSYITYKSLLTMLTRSRKNSCIDFAKNIAKLHFFYNLNIKSLHNIKKWNKMNKIMKS